MSEQNTLLSPNLARWFQIISVGMITLVAFEAVAVTTAMPYVVDSLGGERFYAIAAGIPMAAQLLTVALAGPWCDSHGPRTPLVVGVLSFVGGLVIAAAAPTIEVLIIGRAIQGLGGGLLIVPLYVMVGAYIEAERQPAFLAAFAIAWVLPSLVGPIVAGAFVEYVHWRMVFAICPILYAIVLPFAARKFLALPPVHERLKFQIPRTVLISAIVTGAAVAGLQVISGVKPEDFAAIHILATVVIGAVALLAARYLLPRGTFFAKRGVPATVLFRGLLNGTLVATELFLPLMLKNVHGWGATRAGFVMTASSLTWALASWIQGRIHGSERRMFLAFIGPLIQIVGTALVLVATLPSVSGWWVLVGWLVAGFGTGLIYPQTTVHALALTPPARHGAVSSALNISDTLGASMLVAFGGILYAIAYELGAGAFAVTIGFEMALVVLALWVGRRIMPPQAVAE